MKFEARRPKNDEERVLPLINVVFLLLIFFMLAGRLAVSDPFQITPPASTSAGETGQQDMLVLVDADGRLALDGEIMSQTALREAVAARIERDGASPVRMKADGRADATGVVAVMETLREAGVDRLELLTVPENR